MAIMHYDNDNPTTVAGEPSVAYVGTMTTPKTDSMSVEEYFNKVRKALDRRYENL